MGAPEAADSAADMERHVVLPARLTGQTLTELRAELLQNAGDRRVRRMTVDCGAVEELGPYALTVFIAATRTARAHGGAFELVAPSSVVASALDRLGLHKVLTVVATETAPRP